MKNASRSELMYAADHLASNAANCAEMVHHFAIGHLAQQQVQSDQEDESAELIQKLFEQSEALFALKAALLDAQLHEPATGIEPFIAEHRRNVRTAFQALDMIKALIGRLGHIAEAVVAAQDFRQRTDVYAHYANLARHLSALRYPIETVSLESRAGLNQVQSIIASRRMGLPMETAEKVCASRWTEPASAMAVA